MSREALLVGTVVISLLPVAVAQAQSGTFRQPYDVGFGGSEVADPIHPNRFWQVTEKTMNRLVRPGEGGVPAPDLAVEWSANDDATEWTFRLREGIEFHDGSDFDAADVVYSLQRIKDPEIDSPVASVLQINETVESQGATPVRIKLYGPHADHPMRLMD
jgi:peptide/nickel transport system substrate-binding protein